jgi:hypothetical protein
VGVGSSKCFKLRGEAGGGVCCRLLLRRRGVCVRVPASLAKTAAAASFLNEPTAAAGWGAFPWLQLPVQAAERYVVVLRCWMPLHADHAERR